MEKRNKLETYDSHTIIFVKNMTTFVFLSKDNPIISSSTGAIILYSRMYHSLSL